MLKRHSAILQNQLTELTKNTDINKLVPKLISNNVFTQEMVDRILHESGEDRKLQTLSLYLGVCKRGPRAFAGLTLALMESGHATLGAQLLRADVQDHIPPAALDLPPFPLREDSPDCSPTHHCRILHSANPFQLPEYMENGLRNVFRDGHTCPDDIVNLSEQNTSNVTVQYAREPKIPNMGLPECYRMMSKPRGYALIINNINFEEEEYPTRNGAHNDERAMEELLRQLYFEVESYRDRTKQEMMSLVERFSAKQEWKTVDCSFLVLMSHGREGDSEEDTEIVGTDGLGFKVRDVLSYFYNDTCPYLINKPKIFIFQSCRGALTDSGVVLDRFSSPQPYRPRTETDGKIPRRQTVRDRSQSDMFIAHPVPPGIKANRDRYSGAWFIQTIVQVFSEFSHELVLEDLFKVVDQRIKMMINLGDINFQTVTTRTIGWNKRLYFNPGLHYLNGQLVTEYTSPPQDMGMDVVDTPAESQYGDKKEDLLRLTYKEDDEERSGCFRCRPS